ncbi:MAG: peptidoglycan glycosyltransferase, partial [Alkaliphilus sp.]|nr:peptidoglycan glycosyltransferase [Alkaliphilus sp.]
MDLESKRIVRVLIVLSTMLVGLVLYLSYFEVFKADQIESHSFNRRQWLNEELVIRGSIIDRNGKILAYSEKVEDIQSRIYKYGSLYSHIIGYSHKEYGKSGIEASYNKLLIDDESNPIRVITDKITGTRDKGNNVILTIDHELQIMA